MGGISIWQLLIVLAIVVLLFGTKRLRNIGGDLGNAVKGFKKSMQDDESASEQKQQDEKLQDAQQKEQSEKPNQQDKSN